MEQVFWLMWASDVVGAVNTFGAVCLIALGLGLAGVVFFTGLFDGESPLPELCRAMKVGRWLLLPVVVAILVPGQKTIQLLAVASAADAAASTQLGQKGIQALDAVLDRVISEAKKK